MAAKMTAIAGLLAATAAAPSSSAEAAETLDQLPAANVVSAAELAAKVELGGAKSCGCSPCWGPPAPPDMSWLPRETA